MGQDAEVLVDVAAGVDGDDRDPGVDGAPDRVAERVGVRDRDHEPIRLGCHGRVDQLRHGDHVERLRGVVLDRDAKVRGGLVDAVLHDRPERVGCLAVGDDLDVRSRLRRAAPLRPGSRLLVAHAGEHDASAAKPTATFLSHEVSSEC